MKAGFIAALAAFAVPSTWAAAVAFEHLPESNSTLVSFHAIGGPVLADDFDPAVGRGGSIVFAEWWGSAATSTSWELTLHLGGLSGGLGQPLAIPAAAGGFKTFVTSAGVDPDGDGIFYFSSALPGTFSVNGGPQPFGSEYWFSIANAASGWTWAFAGAGPTIGDEHWSAAQSVGSTPCLDGGPHCGAWVTIPGRDFAFRLSTVPEPSTWMMLGGALVALGCVRRLRIH